MTSENRDDKEVFASVRRAAAAVVCILCAVAFIPPHSVGGITLRRANILSELLTFDDEAYAPAESTPLLSDLADDDVFGNESGRNAGDQSPAEQESEAGTVQTDKISTAFEWIVERPDTGGRRPAAAIRRIVPSPSDTARIHATLVPIEDFDTTADNRMRALCKKLTKGTEPVHIAFFGDSFIEGDILTCDLRRMMQQAYGGAGFGFAPVASPLTGYRRTVKTTSKGWTSYNIMQYDRTPDDLRGLYSVSGWVCQPSDGASTRWERPDDDQTGEVCTDVRLLFVSRYDSTVEITVDDRESRTFDVTGDASVRQIRVACAGGIRSVTFRVVTGSKGFVGYGAIFGRDDCGVSVDNYSIRSNSGQAMLRTDPEVNTQIGRFIHYDLVVLQYGLNIMQQGARDYSAYAKRLDRMIAYVRRCFPNAAILVIGVSDRSVRDASGFVSMDAVPYLTETQRDAARRNGAAFWSAADAMRALGGMSRFVQNGWAGKDYTHITYAGGRRVAEMLFDALNAHISTVTVAIRHEEQSALDSVRLLRMEDRLLTRPEMNIPAAATSKPENLSADTGKTENADESADNR